MPSQTVRTRQVPQQETPEQAHPSATEDHQRQSTICGECKERVRAGARRQVCVNCNIHFHIKCISTTRLNATRLRQQQNWSCPACKLNIDSNISASHQSVTHHPTPTLQSSEKPIRILQWNANAILREANLLEDPTRNPRRRRSMHTGDETDPV